MGLVILLLFILNIAFGSVTIPPLEILQIIFGTGAGKASWQGIIVDTRFPQAITAVLAGAALGVSGLMMQTLFRNPLAGPSVLGVSSGASLGVALLMLLTSVPGVRIITQNQITNNFSVVIAAFAGAFAVLVIIMLLAAKYRSNSTILIIGIMLAYVISAIVGILQFYSLKEDLQAFIIWGLGSFSNVSWQQLTFFIPVVIFGLGLSILMIKPMNAILLGDNYARNLGFNVKRISILLITGAGILVAVVTAYCGPIAFLGIAIPHLSRNLFKSSDHFINVPGTILSGIMLALFCNMIARLPGFDGALPINAITSLIGAPLVIWIIIKSNHYQKAV
ncbi:MAG: iron ABC transporter permease [Bacteroidales bacterium]|nr:iron ABC transporter permease [Bacteroidales bacterium]